MLYLNIIIELYVTPIEKKSRVAASNIFLVLFKVQKYNFSAFKLKTFLNDCFIEKFKIRLKDDI